MSRSRRSIKFKDEYRTKKIRRFIIKLVLVLSITIVLIGAVLYVLFFLNFFNISEVRISGNETISADLLNSSVNNWLDRYWLFPIKRRYNFLIINKNGLADDLIKNNPRIKDVRISNNLKRSLFINISERKPNGVWCLTLKNQCFYFDESGLAYAGTGPSNGTLFYSVSDQREREISPGSNVESDQWIKSIIATKKLLDNKKIGVFDFVIPEDSFDEFRAKTSYNWDIVFSISTDILRQIDAMSAVLAGITPDKIKSLQYVDLSIQDRVYYK